MKLIKFTTTSDLPVWINPETVTTVEESNRSNSNTRVDFVGGSHGYLKETVDVVVEAMTAPYRISTYGGVQ